MSSSKQHSIFQAIGVQELCISGIKALISISNDCDTNNTTNTATHNKNEHINGSYHSDTSITTTTTTSQLLHLTTTTATTDEEEELVSSEIITWAIAMLAWCYVWRYVLYIQRLQHSGKRHPQNNNNSNNSGGALSPNETLFEVSTHIYVYINIFINTYI